MQGVVYLARTIEPSALTWLAGALAVVSGLALLAGFLTPASGAIAGLTTLFIVATWTPPGTSVLVDRFAALILIVDAAALALLGPGAHSLDARLFGRREIIIFGRIRCRRARLATETHHAAHSRCHRARRNCGIVARTGIVCFLECQKVARSDSTVLINGETGTGKELVARARSTGAPADPHARLWR